MRIINFIRPRRLCIYYTYIDVIKEESRIPWWLRDQFCHGARARPVRLRYEFTVRRQISLLFFTIYFLRLAPPLTAVAQPRGRDAFSFVRLFFYIINTCCIHSMRTSKILLLFSAPRFQVQNNGKKISTGNSGNGGEGVRGRKVYFLKSIWFEACKNMIYNTYVWVCNECEVHYVCVVVEEHGDDVKIGHLSRGFEMKWNGMKWRFDIHMFSTTKQLISKINALKL